MFILFLKQLCESGRAYFTEAEDFGVPRPKRKVDLEQRNVREIYEIAEEDEKSVATNKGEEEEETKQNGTEVQEQEEDSHQGVGGAEEEKEKVADDLAKPLVNGQVQVEEQEVEEAVQDEIVA